MYGRSIGVLKRYVSVVSLSRQSSPVSFILYDEQERYQKLDIIPARRMALKA